MFPGVIFALHISNSFSEVHQQLFHCSLVQLLNENSSVGALVRLVNFCNILKMLETNFFAIVVVLIFVFKKGIDFIGNFYHSVLQEKFQLILRHMLLRFHEICLISRKIGLSCSILNYSLVVVLSL